MTRYDYFINDINRGRLSDWEVAYTNPPLPPPPASLPLKLVFTLINETGGMSPCVLSFASDSGAGRICLQGATARELSDRAGEPTRTAGRFF